MRFPLTPHSVANFVGVLVLVAGAAVIEIRNTVRDVVFPPNELYAANDRRRAILKDTVIFKRYIAKGLMGSMAFVCAVGIGYAFAMAYDGWSRIPPAPFVPCLEDQTAGPSVRTDVLAEARVHGAWCSTLDQYTALPCLCCFSDGFCWHSVDFDPNTSGPKMTVTDAASRDRRPRTQELPMRVRACYYRTPRQLLAECEDETDPARIVALFRAQEMRSGAQPAGEC